MFKSLRKPSVVGIGAVIVLLGLAVGIVLYKSHQDRIHYQSSLHRLSGEIETVLLSQKELANQLAESEEQSAGYRQRTDALLQRLREERERLAAQVKESQALFHRRSKDIAAIESQLNLARRQIRSLESADAAGERIIRRYHGGVAFIDLRDASGVVQVVIRDASVAEELRAEYCLKVVGEVARRPEGNENPELPTGDIEVLATEIEILSPSDPLPFPIDDSLYGLQPESEDEYGVNLGSMATRGERGTLIVSLDSLIRMSSNPFFSYMLERIGEGAAAR